MTYLGKNIGFCVTVKITKEHKLSLGSYPDLSLKDARIKCDEIQTARAKGERLTLKTAKVPQTFSDAADEWLTVRMKDKAESYLRTVRFRLNKYILPALGSWPLREITSGNRFVATLKIQAMMKPQNE